MGRSPSYRCAKYDDEGLNRGAWTANEDKILSEYIKTHGVGPWRTLSKKSGLKRCGKSCRLRWLNYLRPDIKRGNISPEEEELIIRLHRLLGNRWSLIAGRLPGRTDNELKNYWITHLSKIPRKKTHLSKRVQMGEFGPNYQKHLKRRDSPSYSSDYNGEKVVVEDHYICQNAPVETTAVKFCERVIVDVHNTYNYDALDPLGIHQEEKEEFKEADDRVGETGISKSWCQFLLEEYCMGDYQYDRLELINGDNIQGSSHGTSDHLLESPFLSPGRSKTLQETHSSFSCSLVNHAFPHSEHLESLMELGELSSLLP